MSKKLGVPAALVVMHFWAVWNETIDALRTPSIAGKARHPDMTPARAENGNVGEEHSH